MAGLSRRAKVITIDCEELNSTVVNKDASVASADPLLKKIKNAFGSDDDCLGILAVVNIPQLEEKRNILLPLARELAILPSNDLEEVTVPEAQYQVGWSHGKEKLEGDNNYDTAKGSFYANPLTDDFILTAKKRNDSSKDQLYSMEDLDQVVQQNPEFFAPNVWPSKLPMLKKSFIDAASIIHKVGIMLARLCDIFVQSKLPPDAKFTKLEDVLRQSLICKGRLLHYFPCQTFKQQNNENSDTHFSSWCGWHNDHGSLTGLLPGMYLNKKGEKVLCTDDNAGLYIKSRGGQTIQLQLPSNPNCALFQIGETTQIHSGGILQATPHAVRASANMEDVSRESFAVFMEPEYHGNMNLPDGKILSDVQDEKKACTHFPKSVKILSSRFKPGMNFGQFHEATINSFH